MKYIIGKSHGHNFCAWEDETHYYWNFGTKPKNVFHTISKKDTNKYAVKDIKFLDDFFKKKRLLEKLE